MLIPDKWIKRFLEQGRLVIDPAPTQIQPASVDLHLGPIILKPKTGETIDRYGPQPTTAKCDEYDITHIPYRLYPDDFVLVSTDEVIGLPDPQIAAVLVGKSTLARDGLQVEAAGFVDAGWIGRLTLELKNLGKNTIILRYQQPICQIRYEYMVDTVERMYGDPTLSSHYQGADQTQAGFTPAPVQLGLWEPVRGDAFEERCTPGHPESPDPQTHTSASLPDQIPLVLDPPVPG